MHMRRQTDAHGAPLRADAAYRLAMPPSVGWFTTLGPVTAVVRRHWVVATPATAGAALALLVPRDLPGLALTPTTAPEPMDPRTTALAVGTLAVNPRRPCARTRPRRGYVYTTPREDGAERLHLYLGRGQVFDDVCVVTEGPLWLCVGLLSCVDHVHGVFGVNVVEAVLTPTAANVVREVRHEQPAPRLSCLGRLLPPPWLAEHPVLLSRAGAVVLDGRRWTADQVQTVMTLGGEGVDG